MMKLSDALRGAADRAPVEGGSIATRGVRARIARERALRGTTTALVGAGAAAVIAVGAAGQGMPSTGDFATTSEQADAGAYEGAMEDSRADAMQPAFALCGGDVFEDTWGEPSLQFDAALSSETWDPGVDAELTVAATAVQDVDLLTSGPEWVVAWNGIAVGVADVVQPLTYGPADEAELDLAVMQEVTLSEGETWTNPAEVPLVNCWDGSPLPGGEYSLVTRQSFFEAQAADAGEATGFRVSASPVAFTVTGEVPEDPFGEYLGRQSPQPEPLPEPLPEPVPDPENIPDDMLTPDIARQLFEMGRVDGAWDMAAGSQRWVKVNDAENTSDSDWQRNFYGCSWDGTTGTTFPERSAEVELLGIDVDAPARLGVSYGWVVDGNPLVRSSATNISTYSVPSLWNGAPQLYLVRDGRVVAEASLHNVDRGGMSLFGRAEPAVDTTIAPWDQGVLSPGASVGGEFLWRDVNGCSDGSGFADVQPGSYTLLATHSLHISGPGAAAQSSPNFEQNSGTLRAPERGLGGGVAGDVGVGGTSSSDAAVYDIAEEPAIDMPQPIDMVDFVELQSWTSLGAITVSR